MSVKHHPLIAWIKDAHRLRKVARGEFNTDDHIAPYSRPLDAAYYRGWVDGWQARGERTEQLELFEVKR